VPAWRLGGSEEVLRDGFPALDADLVALQETVVGGGADQVAEIFDGRYHVLHAASTT
jgi:hypothetical protein